MFYLKNYFALICKYPIRGFLFLAGHFLLFSCCYYGPDIQKNFWAYYGDPTLYPYFYVLYSGESDPDYIRGKVMQVPGVREVELVDSNKMWAKVQETLKGMDIPSEYLPKDLKAIKVSVVANLTPNALGLMEDYLKRLSGDSELTVTGMRENVDPKMVRQKQMMLFFKDWGELITLIFIIGLWILGLYLFRTPMREVSELLENYQRKSKVELKILLCGLPLYNLVFLWSAIHLTIPFIPGLIGVNIMYLLIVLLTSQKHYA